MLKRIALIVVILLVATVVFVFTSLNTGEMDVDLGFGTITQPVPWVLTATFVLGWLFGILCMGFFAL